MTMLGSNKHEEHEEGESWLISYADMMTLLFGFFVIMYSMSQVDESKFAEFRKEISETFGGEFVERFGSEVGHLTANRQLRAFQMLMAMAAPGENMEQVVKEIETASEKDEATTALAGAIRKTLEKTDAIVKPGRTNKEQVIDIALPADMLFLSGSDRLTVGAQKKIAEIGKELTAMNGVLGVEVVGHSDGQKGALVPGKPDNWALSSLRASAVARALIAQGVERRTISVSGVGDLEPMFPERTATGQLIRENLARNRRVHLIIKKAAANGNP